MDREQAIYTAGSLFAIYGVAYFVCAIEAPRLFMRRLALQTYSQRTVGGYVSFRDKILVWLRGFLALAGTGYFVYRATQPLVDWLPFDWGSHNEDGDWEPARDTVRSILTLFGTVWMMAAAERMGKAGRD